MSKIQHLFFHNTFNIFKIIATTFASCTNTHLGMHILLLMCNFTQAFMRIYYLVYSTNYERNEWKILLLLKAACKSNILAV